MKLFAMTLASLSLLAAAPAHDDHLTRRPRDHRSCATGIGRLRPDANLALERGRVAGVLAARVQPGVDHLVQERLAQLVELAAQVLRGELDRRRLVGDAARRVGEAGVVRDPVRRNLAGEIHPVVLREEELQLRDVGETGIHGRLLRVAGA